MGIIINIPESRGKLEWSLRKYGIVLAVTGVRSWVWRDWGICWGKAEEKWGAVETERGRQPGQGCVPRRGLTCRQMKPGQAERGLPPEMRSPSKGVRWLRVSGSSQERAFSCACEFHERTGGLVTLLSSPAKRFIQGRLRFASLLWMSVLIIQ